MTCRKILIIVSEVLRDVENLKIIGIVRILDSKIQLVIHIIKRLLKRCNLDFRFSSRERNVENLECIAVQSVLQALI